MIQKRIIHPVVRRINKKNFTYAAMGFVFAAVEMNITSLSYYFPIYRRLFVYGIMPTYFVLLVILLPFRKNHIKTISLIQLGLLLTVCTFGIITSVFNENRFSQSLAWMVSLLLIPVFFITFESKLPLEAVKGISVYCRIILVAYLISVVLFRKEGMYLPEGGDGARNYYFLGHVNSSIKLVLPAVTVFAIVDIWEKGKIRFFTWILTIATLAIQFYTESYIAAFGMCIYVFVLLLFPRKGGLVDRLPKWSPLALSGLVFLIIVAVRSLFHSVVQFGSIFGRSMSIVNRGIIWDMGFSAIEKNIYGYGPFCDYSRLIRIGRYFPSSAHNLYLDAAIQIGVIGSTFFIVLLFLLIIKMPSWKKWPVIPAALFSYSVMWNFEPYFVDLYLQCTLLLLFLMFHLPQKMEKGLM